MANTYTQLYTHIVFAVKNRRALIHKNREEELYKYITGIVQNKGQKMIAINGMSNHIHILVGLKPNCCLSDLVREIKKSSNQFIHLKKFTNYKFEWQIGFGAFSLGSSQLNKVINYIANQKEHHKRRTFHDEYIEFLKDYDVEFRKEYLFNWLDEE